MSDDLITQHEEWRDVDWAIGYQVSNHGRLRSRWQKGGFPPKPRLTDKWRVLRGSSHKLGYTQHYMTTETGLVRQWVHRIVAMVFLGKPPSEKAEVRHLDGDPKNNNVKNLAWGTHIENMRDIDRHKRRKLGQNVPNASLTDDQVKEVVQLWAMGMIQADIANQYSVSLITINRICNGLKWQSVTGLKPIRSTGDDTQGDNPPAAKE